MKSKSPSNEPLARGAFSICNARGLVKTQFVSRTLIPSLFPRSVHFVNDELTDVPGVNPNPVVFKYQDCPLGVAETGRNNKFLASLSNDHFMHSGASLFGVDCNRSTIC